LKWIIAPEPAIGIIVVIAAALHTRQPTHARGDLLDD
jgi:hypothetical protein